MQSKYFACLCKCKINTTWPFGTHFGLWNKIVYQFRNLCSSITLLKYISENFCPQSIMSPHSFDCTCKRTTKATHFIFKREHKIVNLNKLYQLRGNRSISVSAFYLFERLMSFVRFSNLLSQFIGPKGSFLFYLYILILLDFFI